MLQKLKKVFVGNVMVLIVALGLCACGNRGSSDNQRNDEIWTIQSTKRECLLPTEREGDWLLLSSQYVQGQVVQFWGIKKVNENAVPSLDIYIYRADGTSELLFSNVSTKYQAKWFLDKDGNYFILQGEELTKVDKAGNTFYKKTADNGFFVDICQLRDGSVIVLVQEEEGMKLLKLDSDSGEKTELLQVDMGEEKAQSIAAGDEGLLLLNTDGIWQINISDGSKTCLMDFVEASFDFDNMTEDFLLTEEGTAELLYSGQIESLKIVDISEGKTVIVVRDNIYSSYMYDYAYQFNASSDKYYVVLEEREQNVALADYRERTNVEIGTGGGPDIICQDLILSPAEFMEKGIFEDLTPYMSEAGLKEEDFFPAAFDFWRDGEKIYGACMTARIKGLWMSEDLLGDCREPDVETLVDALLDYDEPACFKAAWEAEQVLDYFLIGSESMWGMLDWEEGNCEFSGELFAKMLEAAKRFGYDEKKAYPALTEFMRDGFYVYEPAEQMLSEGKVPVGYIFEDGCYQAINQTGVMAINSNSDDTHKQGAWEFIAFLLGEQVQSDIHISTYPVSKAAFEKIAAREIEEGCYVITTGADGSNTVTVKTNVSEWPGLQGDVEAFKALHDLTEEKADEIYTLLDGCRPLSVHTADIRSIIWEEAMEYFNGSKSIEEVVAVIENRVNLYMDENY